MSLYCSLPMTVNAEQWDGKAIRTSLYNIQLNTDGFYHFVTENADIKISTGDYIVTLQGMPTVIPKDTFNMSHISLKDLNEQKQNAFIQAMQQLVASTLVNKGR